MTKPRFGGRLLVAGCALLLGLLTACSGDSAQAGASGSGGASGSEQADATGNDQAGDGDTNGKASQPGVQPLTGRVRKSDSPANPVLAVKIDNTPSAAPQVGLRSADLVVEELVEGGSTRLAAMFSSTLPRLAGPVRSMRASDIGIVRPAQATLVASGGAPRTIRRLVGAKIDTTVDGDAGYLRAADRTAPYNLMVRVGDLAGSLPEPDGDPPAPYLPFGDVDMSAGKQARAFEVEFTPGRSTSWRFNDGTYRRADSLAAAGDEFAADSVLVLRVRVASAGYKDPAGNRVPETVLDGKGDATLFHDGSAVTARWRKNGLGAPIELADPAGGAVAVAPGRTWVLLVPVDGGSVRLTR
ncbi:DUF3048 domain-containing protein [soil metagenome]